MEHTTNIKGICICYLYGIIFRSELGRPSLKKKKKKKMTIVILGGASKILKMSSFLKLCLKSILSYSESFETHLFLGENWVGTPILSRFQAF